ncbi:Lacal_2735 family protein [Exilibacterium tricleocarpae]|uniref:Lacal_2735 family protein n=1 Tax=Exilibacterium tricleocarpae TaxID=2591008 RepID=A0A545TKE6_9GAMM|nr:DUF6435 family protein [Exilibacterium tricleocarpae]TQV77656.1 Lacal_2735 family protein [Exilibacterium tricleocarpae]
MFGLFSSNPVKKLNKRYHVLLREAMEAQRSGDIRLYSELSEKADFTLKEIEKAKEGTPEK